MKKIVAMLIIVLMAVKFTACGGTNQSKQPNEANANIGTENVKKDSLGYVNHIKSTIKAEDGNNLEDVLVDDIKNTITILISKDGMAEPLYEAIDRNILDDDFSDSLVESMKSFSDKVSQLGKEYGYDDVSVIVRFVDDTDINKIIIEIVDKVVTCDITKEDGDLTTTRGIEKYLNLNYNTLENTPLGNWKFDIEVQKNSLDSFCMDYTISVDIVNGRYVDLCYGNNASQSEKLETDALLKNHIKTLATDIINKVPSKKFHGYYHLGESGSDDQTFHYTWSNYDGNYSYSADYYNTNPSTFRFEKYTSVFYEK